MSGTSDSAGPSGATRRTLGEGTSSDIGPVKRQKLSKEHPAAGLKLTIHGNVYQLKLLTLFLKRGLDLGHSFALTTELVEAEKFDDIVFGYTDENGKDVCRFLQAKHKQDKTKKITESDLLTEKDDDFSIKKYFISYCKIKRNPEFEGYHLQDFTICTNINLDANLANNFEEITSSDNILHFESHKGFRRYKINLDQFPEKDKLLLILRRTSEHLRLANMLAVCMLDNKPLILSGLFKAYHGALGEKVIECVEIDGVKVGKFRSEFINIDGKSKQSPELKKFRKSFYEEYLCVSKKQTSENDFRVKMKDTKLKISSTFGKKFELDPNPLLTSDKEALAEEIVKAIKGANKNTVRILRERGKKGSIIKDNIDKLAGYVFVKREDENKEFYFNSKFLNENEKLPHHLEEFRAKFIEKLKSEGIEFSKMNEYKFGIANFRTCEEGQLDMKPFLPDDCIHDTDIQGFFESFVLSVNQPNEKDLGDIIQEEIGKNFNLIDSELMASKLQKDMLNWMKEKKGRFLTNEEGNLLFEEIRQKVSKLVLIGPTLVYLAKIKQYEISFRDDLFALREFLNSEHEQIFNLISSCDDTIFSSIKVIQTLKKLDTYQTEDSYVYMRLDSLLDIWNHVMVAFSSRTSNLLAIECKAEKNEAKLYKLYKELSALLKSENHKKVILITSENDTFAEKFKCDFSENDHYKEIKDEKINLTDLNDKSKEKILMEGKVIFLGKEVCLDAMVDAESTHLLSGEVLSMLVNNDKLEIGKPPIDPTHIEVEDYFIDRTLIRHVMVRSDFMMEKTFLVLDDQNPDRPFELCDVVQRELGPCNVLYTDIILISDTRDTFIKLREKYGTQHSIHWLKKEEEAKDRYVYKWQQSCGHLTNLRRFIDKSVRSVTKYKPNKITDVSDKVVLVAAEPGMGKSAMLSHLSVRTLQSIPSPLWIVKSNLISYSSEFSHWMETNPARPIKISVLEAVKFLYIMFGNRQNLVIDPGVDERTEDEIYLTQTEQNIEIIVGSNIIKNMTGSSLLEINLFAHFFNKGKVLLLFDGFDEICPYYKDLVKELLTVLIDTKKVESLWLTTRHNMQCETENQLSTFAYTLQPFLKENQRHFLKKFWKKNMKIAEFDEAKANVFIEELLYTFSKSTNDPYRKFTSIPLQIYMIADVFFDEFKEFYFSKGQELSQENKDTLTNKLDLVSLYEKFLENKLDIELKKIFSDEHDRKKSGALILEKDERSKFRISHEILAMCGIFEADQCKKVLSTGELEKIKELKAQISEAGKKTGVIVNIVDDKPEFIHLTFAEYFAAQFIWRKLISNIELEEFKGKIVCDIVIEMLIEDDAIQISKFLALIARENFNRDIDFSTWKSKIEVLFWELTNQIINDYYYDAGESAKFLLGIIEFFLQKQEEENYSNIIENQSPNLLCVCAEMGYIKLATALTGLNTELLKQHLSKRKWSHCPLWLAAENGHLDMIEFLVEQFDYKAEWQDGGGQSLIQYIFREAAFNVLKSCLELNRPIIDCRPYKDSEGVEYLPVYEALAKQAPVKVIKLLVEKTNAGIMNTFFNQKHKLPMSTFMLDQLLRSYDKAAEIIEHALKKGIDFSYCLNYVLCRYRFDNVCNLTRLLKVSPDNRSDFMDRCSSYISRNNLACNLFPIIEQLFKAGIGYSYIGARLELFDQPSDSTYRIAKRVNGMHKLLCGIYNLCKPNDKENYDPVQMLYRLIFNYVRSLGFKAVEITINPNELLILLHFHEECKCEHKNHVSGLIFRVIEMSTHFKHFQIHLKQENNMPITICIRPVLRKEVMSSDPCDPGVPFLKIKHVMMNLFFKYYIYDNSDSNLVKSAVDEVKKHVLLEENTAGHIPTDYFSFYDFIYGVYRSKILENVDEENEHRKESLQKLVKNLLCDVSLLYFHQNYKFTDAWEEILKKVIKLEEAFNKLLGMKKKLGSEHNVIVLDEDKILDILGLKNIACEREDLQKLVSEICDTTTGSNDLVNVLYMLDHLGQQNVIPVLEQWLKLSDESKQIFDLFKELHEGYENLIYAVEKNDVDEVTSALQTVKQDFVKSIINGQDEHYGSPLHYTALKGQADIIKVFLDHGANPNLRLCNDFKKITHFSQAVKKIEKGPFSSDDFMNWTPLYFAVLNDHVEVVQSLIERAADVNHVLNPGRSGYSPLHVSALSCGGLKIARLLLKNGARYNVKNKEGKTPLNLAKSRSDVEKLLRSIDKLFQIVEEGETNAVNSVFEVLDFDLWEAVFSAKNTDDKTLLELTNNDARKDIFELLSEKLQFVEYRVLQSTSR